MKKFIATSVALTFCMGFVSYAQAECTTIDFEDSVTGTPVFGLYTVSPLLSIFGDEAMEVLQEDLTDITNFSILAYNSNGNGSNGPGGENWLPGVNAKSFGNASTVRGAISQDLRIEFNPDIAVASFAIDTSDFGDWFPSPSGGSNPRGVTLKAYDSDGVLLIGDGLSITGPDSDHDVFVAGLRNLTVTVNNAAIAYVMLEFDAVDPGVSFDNIEVCEIQQASIEVTDVVLNTDPETISYCISNEAGGNNTYVTLGDVTVSVGKKG